MLDMGFRPQVDQILREVPDKRQTMLFSATLTARSPSSPAPTRSNASRFKAERAEVGRGRRSSSTPSCRHRRGQARPPRRGARTASAASHSSSCAPSTAPTSSPASSPASTTSRPRPCTGTCRRTPRERALAQFQSGRVSTLVATDVAARGLDVDDITPRDQLRSARTARTTTSTASAAPAVPAAAAPGVTLVLPEQQHDVGKLAVTLGHTDAFDGSGMTRARAAARPPRAGQGAGQAGRAQTPPPLLARTSFTVATKPALRERRRRATVSDPRGRIELPRRTDR